MVGHSDLSERELQILRLVATGAGNKEIASRLLISTNTVKVHLRNIYDKIQVNSRTEAAMYAVQHGLVGNQPESLTVTPTIAPNEEFISPENDQKTIPVPESKRKITRVIWGSTVISLILLVVFLVILIAWQNNQNAEAMNFDTTRWEPLPELNDAREGLALVFLSNQLYAIGGATETGVTGQVTVYALGSNNWEFRQAKPSPVADIQGVTIAGLIYIPGGINQDGTVTNVLEIYNPANDTWIDGAPLPEPRCRYALATLEGMIFLFGGWDGTEFRDSTFLYNPNEDKWEELTSMNSPRAWSGAAVSGGRIYLLGGLNNEGISDNIDVFTPPSLNEPSGKWSARDPMPEERYAFGATALADLVFIVGGKGVEKTAAPDLIFYPETKEWRSFLSPFPEGVINPGVTGAGTHLYIAGGQLNGETQKTVFTYQAFYTASLPIVR